MRRELNDNQSSMLFDRCVQNKRNPRFPRFRVKARVAPTRTHISEAIGHMHAPALYNTIRGDMVVTLALSVMTAGCIPGFSENRSCRERTNNYLRCTRRLTPVDRASQNACMVLEEYHRPICLRCINREGRTNLLAACPSLQTRRASESMALWP